jgi:hypothetical protein
LLFCRLELCGFHRKRRAIQRGSKRRQPSIQQLSFFGTQLLHQTESLGVSSLGLLPGRIATISSALPGGDFGHPDEVQSNVDFRVNETDPQIPHDLVPLFTLIPQMKRCSAHGQVTVCAQ